MNTNKFLTTGRKINTPEGTCTITRVWTDGVSADAENFDDIKFFEFSEVTPILSDEEKQAEAKAQRAAWVKEQEMAFLQNEGYFETARGVVECQTFGHWLKLAETRTPFVVTEPWQKGDLNYGL